MSPLSSTFADDGLREYVQVRLVAAMNLCPEPLNQAAGRIFLPELSTGSVEHFSAPPLMVGENDRA